MKMPKRSEAPESRFSRREAHLALVLLALLSLSVLPSSHGSLQTVQAFSAVVSLPGMTFLCGRLSRTDGRTSAGLLRQLAVWLMLYAGSSTLLFWAQTLTRVKTSFPLLSPTGAPCLFLLAAECNAAVLISERLRIDRRVLLALALLAGLAMGYVPRFANLFGFRQLFAFLPFFLLGRWEREERLELLFDRPLFRGAALALLLGAAELCYSYHSVLMDCETFLLGTLSYSKAGLSTAWTAGGLLRLGHYLLALALLLSLLAWMPSRPIPCAAALEKNWRAGYFWYRTLVVLVAAVPALKGEQLAIDLARMGLIVLLPLLACGRAGSWLPGKLALLPERLRVPTRSETVRESVKKPAFAAFCLAFSLLLNTFLSPFASHGRTLIWTPDGENLYFVIMYYTRDYFLKVIKTLFTTGQLVFPQWDFSIGQGAGVLSVLHLNPFFLLAMLFPRAAAEQVYGLISLGLLACAALAFMALLRIVGQKEDLPVLLGGLLYAFCGYCVFTAAKHIYFTTYLVLGLPLLLYGCERFLRKKKWGVLLLTVVFLFCGGYYYTWMDSLLMAVYLLVRELYLYHKTPLRILRELLQLVGLYLWGMACSMVIFLPQISNLFGSSRSPASGEESWPLTYSLASYKKLLVKFISVMPDGPNWSRLGFVGLVLLALIVLFLRRKNRKWTPLRVLTVLGVVFLCVPACGSIFNGFGYVTNRWSYGFALLMGAAVVYVLPALSDLTGKEQRLLTALTLAYAAVILLLNHEKFVLLSMGLLVFLLLAVLAANHLPDHRQGQQLIALCTVFALLFNVGYYHKSSGKSDAKSYLKWGQGEAKFTESKEAVATGLEDGLYRAEVPANRKNVFCLTGGNGTITYWSVVDDAVVNYYQDFALDSVRQSYALWGLDERASLCALAGVKYFVGSNEDQVPYGFLYQGTDEATGLSVYQNQYALPFAYACDTYYTEEEYEALSPLEKQQVVLQGAVVSEEDAETLSGTLEELEPELTAKEISCEMTDTDGVSVRGGVFEVEKKGGSVTFSFEGEEDCETYLDLGDISAAQDGALEVVSGDVVKKTELYSDSSLYTFQRDGVTFNLGYSQEGKQSCTLIFEKKGTYTVSAVRIVCMPMSDYTEKVTRLGETALENAEETLDGGLRGTIELEKEQLVVFSVPYSTGWRLTVNGEERELMQVNGMYQGALLPAGSYELELHYTEPSLRIGLPVTCLALAGLGGYAAVWCLRRHKDSKFSEKEDDSDENTL